MSVKNLMGVAGVSAGLTVVAVLAVAFPKGQWTHSSFAAAVLLFLSFALPVLLPRPMPRGGNNDAPAIWLIGPLGALYAALAALSAFSLWLGLSNYVTASWVVAVLWVGLLIVGYAGLRASTNIVASAASATGAASDDARSKWIALLRQQTVQTDQESIRRLLDGLAERIRYSANDRGTQQVTENQSITTLLDQLHGAMSSQDELTRLVRSAEGLLEQREQLIRATNSRA